ncbi:MAG TPA: glycoside hydrolase family 2 TIM barrel-domain containing protein [Bacteroidales bacterium]|nr:glycoside hydrolase family 2 TIM barrel-domain containing protein [Bacteroidales bacterium]
MRKITSLICFIILITISARVEGQAKNEEHIYLRDNWAIQSSDSIRENGKIISLPEWKPQKWYSATMPATVLAALVNNKVYPDPYFGTNILSLPGYFAQRRSETPAGSPYRVSWWYRTVFAVPAGYKGSNTWLKLHSINYKANIWVNGKLIADTTSIEGAYRLYDLNISDAARPGEKNCLAIEIFPPKPNDLTITWVDWNPTPPDRGMGIWYDMYLHQTGPVSVENPQVITRLNLPVNDKAKITISADLRNNTQETVTGIISGTIENISFSDKVTLGPNEVKHYTAGPDRFRQLEMTNPRLWWPYTMGPQNLYNLDLSFESKGRVSDLKKVRFGIREISSWMNSFDGKITRVFQVNGKNIVIRGGGYVEDMMLRPSNERINTELMYAKHMGLNAIRMEAPRGSDYIFDRCDEEGILLMVGWCCCSAWENWNRWTQHTTDLAEQSWRDQITRLRNHPAVFDWLYGSDNFPPENVEKIYLRVLAELDGTRPSQSSATKDSSAVAGRTGLWMGPYPKVYAYNTPSYWYTKLEFNTEAGPGGEQVAPLESMKKMMPAEDLWPIGKSWEIRLHKAFYGFAREALKSRYGEPKSLDEYIVKSQILQYEATRGMFEAYAGNKYKSSGIIYWMYNSAWPKMYWQLFDYFFTPNGAFYGTKKACEPVHIQYPYDNASVMVVNGLYREFKNLKAGIKIFDIGMNLKYSKEITTDLKPDESLRITPEGWPKDLAGVSFLKLDLKDAAGKELSSNFYWLSDKGDDKADFTTLATLPRVQLNYSISQAGSTGGKASLILEVENKSTSLAFFVNPELICKTSRDLVRPVLWDDNYFSLLPGEKRKVNVSYFIRDLNGDDPILKISGWNVESTEKEIVMNKK